MDEYADIYYVDGRNAGGDHRIGASTQYAGRAVPPGATPVATRTVYVQPAQPAAPVSTKDIATDVANGITYDTALAQHAKTDEQIRTIGHLVGRLVR